MNKRVSCLWGVILCFFIFSVMAVPGLSASYKELFEQGKQAYKNKQYQDAYELFKQVVTEQPDKAKYQYNLGLAARKLDKYNEAYDAFVKAAELDPHIGFTKKPGDFREKLEEMEKKAGGQGEKPSKIASSSQDPLVVWPHKDLFEEGKRNYKNRYFDSAYKYLQAAVEKDPYNAKYQYNLGLAARKLNRFSEAYEAFKKAQELDPALEFTSKPDNFLKKLAEAKEESARRLKKKELEALDSQLDTKGKDIKKDDKKGLPILPFVVIGVIILFYIIGRSARRKKAQAAGGPGITGPQMPPGMSPSDTNMKYKVKGTSGISGSRHYHDDRYDDVRYYDDPTKHHDYHPPTGGTVSRRDHS